jgi:hypothetical protein
MGAMVLDAVDLRPQRRFGHAARFGQRRLHVAEFRDIPEPIAQRG